MEGRRGLSQDTQRSRREDFSHDKHELREKAREAEGPALMRTKWPSKPELLGSVTP
jgi:hypothetical protein